MSSNDDDSKPVAGGWKRREADPFLVSDVIRLHLVEGGLFLATDSDDHVADR